MPKVMYTSKRGPFVLIFIILLLVALSSLSSVSAEDLSGSTSGKSPDFDTNGIVGISDFLLFAGDFGKTVTAENRKFDLNSDSKIDYDDFFIFSDAFENGADGQDAVKNGHLARLADGETDDAEQECGGEADCATDAPLLESIQIYFNMEAGAAIAGDIIDLRAEISGNAFPSINSWTADIKADRDYIASGLLPVLATSDQLSKFNFRMPDLEPGTHTLEAIVHLNYGAEGTIISKNSAIEIEVSRVNPELCKEIISGHNNPDADRANIVFIGYGYLDNELYSGVETLRNLAMKAIDINGEANGIFSVEPFMPNSGKFNFWYVDSMGDMGEDCVIDERATCINRILESTCTFNNKYTINLINEDFTANSPGTTTNMRALFSFRDCSFVDHCFENDINRDGCIDDLDLRITKGAQGGGAALNSDFNPCFDLKFGCPGQLACEPVIMDHLDPKVVVHEFGHSFGNLMDEYVRCEEGSDCSFLGPSDPSVPNCYAGDDNTQAQCVEESPWKQLIGDGCGDESILDCQDRLETEYISPEEQAMLEIGCFEGCFLKREGIFRSSFNNIMRSQNLGPYSFGKWNELVIQSELDKFSGR